jgi:hypothetical protein
MNQPYCPNCQITLTPAQVDEMVWRLEKRKLQDLWAKLDAIRVKEGWTEPVFRPEQGYETQVQSSTTSTQ